MKVNCGIVHVYMSYDNPHPSSALYSDKLTATDGHPAVLALEKTVDGRPLYMTFVGTQLPAEAADLKNCSDAHFETTFMSVNKSGRLKNPMYPMYVVKGNKIGLSSREIEKPWFGVII